MRGRALSGRSMLLAGVRRSLLRVSGLLSVDRRLHRRPLVSEEPLTQAACCCLGKLDVHLPRSLGAA